VQRQEQLDATGAADHADPCPAPRFQHPLTGSLEAPDEAVDRLDRYGVLLDASYFPCARRRADVDRQDIVGDGRPIATDNPLGCQIQSYDLAVVKAGLCEAGERAGIDMRLVLVVEASDHPRQHPRIGRMDLAGHECETHAGHSVHGQHAQYADMRVPCPDQHDVLHYWCLRRLHLPAFPFHLAGASASRVVSVEIRSAPRNRRDRASITADSPTVARIRTTATSKRSSEMAAST